MPPPHEPLETQVLLSKGTEPTLVNQTGLWRFITPVRDEKPAPCRRDCPLGNGIPGWMEKVRDDDWAAAWVLMERYNPFPALTGYACYGYCQEGCNRGSYDETIAIRDIEKAIGLWKLQQKTPGRAQESAAAGSGNPGGAARKRVAVVGSGPAGLSAAYYLNRLGCAVHVLEKLPAAGGLLATGIPPQRLPRELLAQELDYLQQQGISLETNREIGAGQALDDLADAFDAAVLAVGAQKRRFLGIPGENLPGVFDALDILRNLYLPETGRDEGPQEKGRLLVFGGGNAALDAAAAVLRRGWPDVWVIYRRGREEMPAHDMEIAAAEEAGVRFLFHTRPLEICGEEALTGVRLCKTRPSRRGEGLIDLEDSAYVLSCSAILLAVGSDSGLKDLLPVDMRGHEADFGEDHSRILEIPSFAERGKICLAAGDAVTGPRDIALAIAAGREAARCLVEHFHGTGAWQEVFGIGETWTANTPAVSFEQLSPHYYPHLPRQKSIQKEAERCFSCGICSGCGLCWFFCPDVSVEKESGAYDILLDYCKGCGICAAECPSGVLEMKELKSHENALER